MSIYLNHNDVNLNVMTHGIHRTTRRTSKVFDLAALDIMH